MGMQIFSERMKGAETAGALKFEIETMILLRTRYRRMRQNSLIREAERAIDGIGGRAHLKPLQQGNILRVVGEVEASFLHGDWSGGVRQNLDWITLFEIPLTKLGGRRLPGELPTGG